MATFAQHEAERISQRTKDGLQAARAKGTKLGTPQNLTPEARAKACASQSNRATLDKTNRNVYMIVALRREQGATWRELADLLNREGYTTRRGKQFASATVRNI